jgi:hypothetical protein
MPARPPPPKRRRKKKKKNNNDDKTRSRGEKNEEKSEAGQGKNLKNRLV